MPMVLTTASTNGCPSQCLCLAVISPSVMVGIVTLGSLMVQIFVG